MCKPCHLQKLLLSLLEYYSIRLYTVIIYYTPGSEVAQQIEVDTKATTSSVRI